MPVLTPGQLAWLRTVQGNISTALIADTSITRLVLNGGLDRDYKIAPGETVCGQAQYTVIDAAEAESDSNIQQLALGQSYEVAHKLADPFDESSYRPSPIDEDLAVLMDKWWWKAIDGVIEPGLPERGDIERIGNVIVYTVEVRLAISITGV